MRFGIGAALALTVTPEAIPASAAHSPNVQGGKPSVKR